MDHLLNSVARFVYSIWAPFFGCPIFLHNIQIELKYSHLAVRTTKDLENFRKYTNTMDTKQLVIYLTRYPCQNNKRHCIPYTYTIVKQCKIITVYTEQEKND